MRTRGSTRISTRPRPGSASCAAAIRSSRARACVEDLALALQASLLLRTAPAAVADAFCAARLGGRHRAFGTLPAGMDAAPFVERALAD